MRKVAILIDGAFFLRRLNAIGHNELIKNKIINVDDSEVEIALKTLRHVVKVNLQSINKIAQLPFYKDLHYRTFYYDSVPYANREHYPLSLKSIHFDKTNQAVFRQNLLRHLSVEDRLALRLGQVKKNAGWLLKSTKQQEFIKGLREGQSFSRHDFNDDDFVMDLKQAGVDMRIGVDITTLTLKKIVDTIVLISGDSDFAPAAKLARTEGVTFILDVMGADITENLAEHCDSFVSSIVTPKFNGILSNVKWSFDKEGELL